MSRLIFLLISFALLFSCKNELNTDSKVQEASFIIQTSEKFIPQKDSFNIEQHQIDYKALKKRIALSLRSHRKQANSKDQAPQYFVDLLVDSLFPYWYGTPWDFNGYTEHPRQGKIACGYFISTTLRDMGLAINRYKIAQKASLDILKTFVQPGKIHKFREFEQMNQYLASSREDEVLILGLDYHVGFVVRKDGQLYFIHSNYFGNSQVEKEDFNKSYSAQSSELFYLGSLSDNPRFIARWVGP